MNEDPKKQKVIEIKNLFFSYDRSPVLEDVNLSFNPRDFAAIIGPNGGGKTTLIKLILGLLVPNSGNVNVFGRNPCVSLPPAGYVPQFFESDRNFPISVLDVVISGLLKPSSFFPWNSRISKDKAMTALSGVGLNGLGKNVFGTLSGGQRQRALIARAIVSEPEILILDEPTASVDNSNEKDIFHLFKSLNEKMTVMIVTHDIGFISSFVNRVVCVNRNVKIHDPSSIDEDIIQSTYNMPMNKIVHQCGL